jgi:hypothetical protein
MRTFTILNKTISLVFLSFLLFSFTSKSIKTTDTISGVVYDEFKKPLAEVEIINLNNNFVSISKEDGSFTISGKPGDLLQFIYSQKITKIVSIEKVQNNKIYFEDQAKIEKLKEKELKKSEKKNKRKTKREASNSIKTNEKYSNPYKKSLIGLIYDDMGGIVGATVKIKGTTVGTTTDFDGYYGIDAKIGDEIEVSYLGYKTIVLKVTKSILNIELISHTEFLDEIVITGYGSTKKEAVTGSAVKLVESETIKHDAPVLKSLEGKTSGLSIIEKTEDSKIIIRGASSISEDKSIPSTTPAQKAGQLTSGEVNDFSHWNYWQGLTNSELNKWKNHWKFNPTFRYSVIITNQDGFPIINKKLHLINASGEKIWTSRTDNTGRAELWYNPNAVLNSEVKESLTIIDDSKNIITKKAIEFHEGINLYEFNEKCNDLNKVNIAFMIDATGSMADEITYLQAELNDVIARTKKALPSVQLSMGSVFYRDHGDEYLTKNFDFTSDISNVISFIQKQKANGGGDYPEAVIEGLEASINQINWDDDARTKLLFIMLDAPPHYDDQKIIKLQNLAKRAAEKGIRIIPVAASGINKSTEFLMRAMALETNGTYLFITNHSGIGNDHIEPSTESYKVEMLNDLILRIILQYSEVNDCLSNENYPNNTKIEEKIKDDVTLTWSIYPNPTQGHVTIDISEEATELYVYDTTGKLIFYQDKKNNQFQIDLTGFPNAIYYIKAMVKNKQLFGKVIKKN